jgi:L-fucose isomerase-like protein
MSRIGMVAIGRPTFDLELAARKVADVGRTLSERHTVAGNTTIVTEPRMPPIGACDALVVVQATFTDARLPVAAAAANPGVPVILWALPEPRTGDRLRLNSLCGANLAASALTDRDVRYVYEDPKSAGAAAALDRALGGPLRPIRRPQPSTSPEDRVRAEVIRSRLRHSRIGRIGLEPDGFDPCSLDESDLRALGNPTVESIDLNVLFDAVRGVDDRSLPSVAAGVGVAQLERSAVDVTRRMQCALEAMAAERDWSGVALRCWPECFDDLGGAACAAMGGLGDRGVPGTCEADVMGVFTSIALTAASGAPSFVADLVDCTADGTVTFWHCGVAPPSMAHPGESIEAIEHPNRHLPLLAQFRLRPGRITIARFNHSGGRLRLVLGRGRILERPRPYAGTCGVVRTDTSAHDVIDTLIGEGLDHHYGITHGDVVGPMTALADLLGIEVVSL